MKRRADPKLTRQSFKEIGGFRGDNLDAVVRQDRVIDDEAGQVQEGIDYPDQHVRLATVHTRQDMVLLVSYSAALARRSKSIRWMVFVIMLCAVLATLKYLGS